MASSTDSTYHFAGIQFDPERGLEKAGTLIPLASHERRLLGTLLAAGGKVMTKDALVRAVWHGAAVSDASISASVYRLRRALELAGADEALATVYGVGFRIAVPIRHPGDAKAQPSQAAQECWQTARELAGRRGLRDMIGATLAARRAARLDPEFAAGWVLLAQVSVARVNRGQIARELGLRRARWAANQALKVSPNADGALALLGWIEAVPDGDTASGLARLDHAIALNGHDWTSHMFQAWALLATRRQDEALAAFAAMAQRNPLSTFAAGIHGYALACRDRTHDALALLNQAIRIMPTVDSLYWARSAAHSIAGDRDAALANARRCAELAPDVPNQRCALAYGLAAAGAVEKARAELDGMLQMRCHLAPSLHALVLFGLKDYPAATQMMEHARTARCTWLPFVQFDPRVRAPASPTDGQAAGAAGGRASS
jgi:DNA-binding winged helix-turn-helix (wHTH) protein/Flp pilus assembly protein TadD